MGGELVSPASPPSYTEIFYKHFPYYLSIGMTYDQYWNDDCALVKYYREADKITREKENEKLWLQGRYIYDALISVSPLLHAFSSKPEPLPYLDEPYPITAESIKRKKEERERANRAKAKAMFEAWACQWKINKEREGKNDG